MTDRPFLTRLARRVRDRDVSSVELTRHALEAAHEHNDRLAMFISIDDEGAVARAQQRDRELAAGTVRGPLHGLPVAVKDNFFIAGQTTTMGSAIHADFVPDHTATSVQRLLDAGAVVIGKTNMDEYALGGTTNNPHYGTCRNPWDPDRSPGGSSGGSTVAVSSGTVPAALGSDTSGSIHIPGALCAVPGLKPTYGRTSRHGCFPEAWTLDTVSSLAAHVEDLAVLLDVLSGADPQDPASMPGAGTDTAAHLTTDLDGVTLGVVEDFFFHDIDPEVERLVRTAISRLEEFGARVEPVEIPALADTDYALTVIDTAEATTVHRQQLDTRRDDYGADVRVLLEAGLLPSAVDYLQAQQVRTHIRSELAGVFTRADALIGPTLPVTAPRIGESTTDLARLLGPANLAGLPSLSVPCGLVNGLPASIQMITAAGDEQTALNIAAAYERTDPLNGARPRIHV